MLKDLRERRGLRLLSRGAEDQFKAGQSIPTSMLLEFDPFWGFFLFAVQCSS